MSSVSNNINFLLKVFSKYSISPKSLCGSEGISTNKSMSLSSVSSPRVKEPNKEIDEIPNSLLK